MLNFVHANPDGALKATRGVELISLPLNEEEEAWFTESLEHGKERDLSGANDTLVMRAIAVGRPESIPQNRKTSNSRKIDGINWDTLRGGMRYS